MANTSFEALERLIEAVGNYQIEIEENMVKLRTAGEMCDAVMGNDGIVRKQLERLGLTLEELKKVDDMAMEYRKTLIDERERIREIYENA